MSKHILGTEQSAPLSHVTPCAPFLPGHFAPFGQASVLCPDGGKLRRAEQRLHTVQREIGAVLAALDDLDAQDAAAAEAAAADADAAAAEPAALEPCDLAGPGNNTPAAVGQPPQRAQHGTEDAAREAFPSGAVMPPEEGAPRQARGGAAQRGLQRAVLRTRLADLEAAQRRLQDGLEAQRAASAAEVRASGPKTLAYAAEPAPALPVAAGAALSPAGRGAAKAVGGARAAGASAGAARRTGKPGGGTPGADKQAAKAARAGAAEQRAAGTGGPGGVSAAGAEATAPAPAPAPPAALEEGGLEAELDAAAKGGLVETERDRLIRLVRQTLKPCVCAAHAAGGVWCAVHSAGCGLLCQAPAAPTHSCLLLFSYSCLMPYA